MCGVIEPDARSRHADCPGCRGGDAPDGHVQVTREQILAPSQFNQAGRLIPQPGLASPQRLDCRLTLDDLRLKLPSPCVQLGGSLDDLALDRGIRLLQPVGHLIEGTSQDPDLAGGVDRCALPESPLGDCAGRGYQIVNRAKEGAHHQNGQDNRDDNDRQGDAGTGPNTFMESLSKHIKAVDKNHVAGGCFRGQNRVLVQPRGILQAAQVDGAEFGPDRHDHEQLVGTPFDSCGFPADGPRHRLMRIDSPLGNKIATPAIEHLSILPPTGGDHGGVLKRSIRAGRLENPLHLPSVIQYHGSRGTAADGPGLADRLFCQPSNGIRVVLLDEHDTHRTHGAQHEYHAVGDGSGLQSPSGHGGCVHVIHAVGLAPGRPSAQAHPAARLGTARGGGCVPIL